MKYKALALGLTAALLLSLTACLSQPDPDPTPDPSPSVEPSQSAEPSAEIRDDYPDARTLILSDDTVTLDGRELSPELADDVVVGHDIVYYQDGTDDTYGEGTEADMHSAEEATAHTVVTIRKPGTYRVSGKLTAGQLAVDLGSDAKRDPQAVVTLILDGVDITCTVAPAVIFYNVYECDTDWVAYDEEETEDYAASPIVDTSAAGANVVLADGSVNNISGSYVARIYKEGTTKKLHKYDGAFYSKMSMNINGGTEGTGVLNITADNEGLDSELHLTINGGNIYIEADNDGINTNEDGVSVTTVNGGTLTVNAGLGEEGDGIDSNGHLVINGGTVYSMASDHSPDGGLDADGEILLNGGMVIGLGVRNDTVSADSEQLYMELSFQRSLSAGSVVELAGPNGAVLFSFTLEKAAQSVILSAPALEQDVDYTLTVDGVVQQYTGHGFGGFPGGGGGQPPELPDGQRPDGQQPGDFQPADGQEPPQMPDGQQFDGQEPPERPDGQRPDGQEPPELSDGQERPEKPDGQRFDGQEPPEQPDGWQFPEDGGFGGEWSEGSAEPSETFTLAGGVCSFSGIADRQ